MMISEWIQLYCSSVLAIVNGMRKSSTVLRIPAWTVYLIKNMIIVITYCCCLLLQCIAEAKPFECREEKKYTTLLICLFSFFPIRSTFVSDWVCNCLLAHLFVFVVTYQIYFQLQFRLGWIPIRNWSVRDLVCDALFNMDSRNFWDTRANRYTHCTYARVLLAKLCSIRWPSFLFVLMLGHGKKRRAINLFGKQSLPIICTNQTEQFLPLLFFSRSYTGF